jgi:hypothetical protein
MIVDTMSPKEVEKEFERDCIELYPIIGRKQEYLGKAFKRSGKPCYQTASYYKINHNQYVVNYIATKGDEVSPFIWIYVSNTKQPYFMTEMLNHKRKEYIYNKVDAHAILRFMKRTPNYVPDNSEAFVKEAMYVTMDLVYPVTVEGRYVSPQGLWPLESEDPINGFLRVKTFIHKSIFTKRQREIYIEGLKLVEDVARPVYEESLLEFGIA